MSSNTFKFFDAIGRLHWYEVSPTTKENSVAMGGSMSKYQAISEHGLKINILRKYGIFKITYLIVNGKIQSLNSYGDNLLDDLVTRVVKEIHQREKVKQEVEQEEELGELLREL